MRTHERTLYHEMLPCLPRGVPFNWLKRRKYSTEVHEAIRTKELRWQIRWRYEWSWKRTSKSQNHVSLKWTLLHYPSCRSQRDYVDVVVTPRGRAGTYQCFGGKYRFHLQPWSLYDVTIRDNNNNDIFCVDRSSNLAWLHAIPKLAVDLNFLYLRRLKEMSVNYELKIT
jgi:hypothetical protein